MNSVTESSGISINKAIDNLMYDIFALGEIHVDFKIEIPRFPKPDDVLFIKHSEKRVSGKIAEFCFGVARQDLRIACISSVGNDENGNFVRKSFAKEGIIDFYLSELEERTTPVYIVIFTCDGQKTTLKSEHTHLLQLPKQLVSLEVLKKARHLHLTVNNLPTALKAAKIAKKLGLSVSLDLESEVVQENKKNLPQLLKYIDLLLTHKKASNIFTKIERPRVAALKLLEYGPKVVIITYGVEGVILSTKNTQKTFPPFKVDNIADTTGARSAFNAGFISAYLRHHSLDDCINQGQASAALKIQSVGDQQYFPLRNEVERFLIDH